MVDAALKAAQIPQLTLLGQEEERRPQRETHTEDRWSQLSGPTSIMKKTLHFYKKEEAI